jgi:hypothetical protein
MDELELNQMHSEIEQAKIDIANKANEMPIVEQLEKAHRGNNLDEQLIVSRNDIEYLYKSGHMDQLAYNKMMVDLQLMYIEGCTIIAE